jgi:O-antigen ligase
VALRNISLFGSMVLLIAGLFLGKIPKPKLSAPPLLLGLGLGVANLIGIAVQQVDISGSLREFWGNMFEDLYIVVAVLTLFPTRQLWERLITLLVASYLIIALFSLIEVVKTYFTYGWDTLMDRNYRSIYRWWGGFSRLSALYLPIAVGWAVLNWKGWSRWVKIGVGAGLLLGFGLMVLYRSSAPIVLTTASIMVLLLFYYRPKKIWILFSALLLVGATYIFDTYWGGKKIFNPASYDVLHNPQSFDGRGGVWRGFLDLMDSPEKWIIGYGYGWKKFGEIGKEYRPLYLEENNTKAYNFFIGYGSANPHNGYLEVLVESGVVGEFLFLLLLGLGLYWAWRGGAMGRYLILPFLLSYISNSFFNGYWEGNGGKLLFLLLTIAYLSYQRERGALPSAD